MNFNGKSRQYVLDMMDQDGLLLRYVPNLDIEIVRRAVQQNPLALQYAKTYYGNLDIGMEAVRQEGRALEFCSLDLKGRRDIVLEAVKQDGIALYSANPSLKADREIVLAAVKQNGGALRYASPRLQGDKEVVLTAVKQDGSALSFASARLQGDKEVVLTAVNQTGEALSNASATLKEDRDVVMTAMRNTPYTIENIPRHVMTKPFVIELVQMNGNILSFLSAVELPFQSDKDVVLAAVNQTGKALRHASSDLQGDKEVVLTAVNQTGEALRYASPDLQGDKEVVLAAVNQTGEALRYASPDLQADPLCLSFAKYSDQPIELTPEQNDQVESFLQESKATYEFFKKFTKYHIPSERHTMKNLMPLDKHPMKNLSNHGPQFHSIFLKKLYGFSGLDKNIQFILQKSKQVPDIGGRKRKTRRRG